MMILRKLQFLMVEVLSPMMLQPYSLTAEGECDHEAPGVDHGAGADQYGGDDVDSIAQAPVLEDGL